MKFPIIDFSNDNEIIISNDIKQDRFAAFSNREILNKWCGSNFCFQASNSIGTENFYNEIPWCEVQGISSGKYYWGEDVTKKVEKKKYICGASPVAYSEFLYEDVKAERKFKTVFYPKSDYPYKTRFKEESKDREKIIETMMDFNSENTIYISFPFDWMLQYQHFMPKEILDKTYVLGYNGFDVSWIKRLKKVLLRSELIYAPYIFSSTVAYATYFDTPVKFYDHDFYEIGINKIEDDETNIDFHIFTSKKYTVVPSERDEKWNSFMQHLKECFDSGSPDKYWWTSKFLSLERIKPPEELYEDLKILHHKFVDIKPEFNTVDVIPFVKSHDLYYQTKEKCNRFMKLGTDVSQKSINYLYEI